MMMNEQEFDALITTSLERQEVLEEISQVVMREVRHSSRRCQWRSWARLLAFSFGLPLVFLCFLFGIYNLYPYTEIHPYIIVCIVFPTITMILFMIKSIKIFSVKEV